MDDVALSFYPLFSGEASVRQSSALVSPWLRCFDVSGSKLQCLVVALCGQRIFKTNLIWGCSPQQCCSFI